MWYYRFKVVKFFKKEKTEEWDKVYQSVGKCWMLQVGLYEFTVSLIFYFIYFSVQQKSEKSYNKRFKI